MVYSHIVQLFTVDIMAIIGGQLQARTEMNTAWSDLAAARRTKEQARLESTEAQNEIARAELLKREAREQLQQASAEKALADHARDMAKRQMDIAEAELADAKRIREQAQAEIEKSRLLKDQQSRESLHSPLHDAAMRVSSRDHNLQMSSNYICEVCKSVPVGRDLALGLHQYTNRTPTMMASRVASWPESTADHKIHLSQINAPNEVSTRTGLVNYLTTRENTSEPSPSYSSYNEPNPTRLFSHMIGEPSTCRSWSVGSGASDAGEGRSSCEFLEASVPTIATFATTMTVQAPSTSKNPRTGTDHSQSQGS
jgi:rubrerythrin